MKRIAFLLLATSMSMPAFADSESWSFVQSVGGIAVETPTLLTWGWVLPVRADVSGLQAVTTKPTTLNSALVCEETGVQFEGRRGISITVFSTTFTQGRK